MSDRELRKSAKAEKLYHGITNIREDIIEEAQNPQPGRKRLLSYYRWGIAAAVLGIALAGAALWGGGNRVGPGGQPEEDENGLITYGSGITVSEAGVTIPPMEVMLGRSDEVEWDMEAFFIYQGNCYVEYERMQNISSNILGEYLGTAIGLIDEWTPMDGYVELAGSVTGDFYSVKGFAPSFLLCMPRDGIVSIFVCNSGITLKTGAELYEERLHLSENYYGVQYETRKSWYYSKGEVRELSDPRDEAVLEFIRALDEAAFMPEEAIELREGDKSYVDSEIYHLYFLTESGITVHLRLHEGGYVRFQGIWNICVQVPEETFHRLTDLLDS